MTRTLVITLSITATLLLWTSSFLTCRAQELDYLVRQFDHRDGLPQNTVNDIIQDEQGFLWIATFGGLARFDGFSFEVFDIGSRDDLPSNRIYRLGLDGRGGLWVGTQDAGLLHFDGERFERIPAPGSSSWGLIEALFQVGPTLWVGHSGGLGRWRAGSCESIAIPEGCGEVHGLFADDDGRLLVGTSGGLLRLTEKDGALETEGPRFDGPVFQLWKDPKAGVRISLGTTIQRLDDDLEPTELWRGDQTGHYWSALQAKDSEYWLGGYNLTVLGDDMDPSQEGRRFDSLPSAPYRALFRDREGNIWVGTSGAGLFGLSPRSYTLLSHLGHNSSPPAVQICTDNGDGRPLCLFDSLLIADKSSHRLIEEPSLPTNLRSQSDVSGILRLGSDIWTATRRGVFRYVEGEAPQQVIDEEVSGLLRCRSGHIWTGGRGVVHHIRGDEIETLTLSGTSSLVTPIQETADGALWLTSRREVLRFQDGQLRIWSDRDGIAGPIRTLHVDDKDRVWVASYGRGLSYIDGTRIGRLTVREGLADDSLGAILPGRNGALWINSNRGVFSLSGEALDGYLAGRSERVHSLRVDSGEGNGPSGFKAPDGTLWFPTVEGLVGIEPEAIKNTAPRIRSVFSSVTVGGIARDPSSELHIRSGPTSIGISYTAIHLRNPAELRFRYRLIGYDDDWTIAGTRREANFGGLGPGEYEFQVESTIAGFPWSGEPTTLVFTIDPALHQSSLFWFVIGLGFLLGLFLLYSMRIRKLEAEHQRETDSLARSAQQAEDRLRVEKELEEAKRFETVGRLAGSIAHDFNNILMAQMGHAELIRFENGQDAREQIKGHVAEIIRSSNRAAKLVRQIMDFSQDHRKKLRPVRLHVVLDRVIPFLGPLLPANIQLSVELSTAARSMEVDESAAEQLLLNLILNARDAMPQGGRISVSAELVTADQIEARGHGPAPEGLRLCLSVADDGQGIATENVGRIFDSFFTTKERGLGTGLGLVTVKSVVDEAGGFIRVDTEVGVGTRFSIYLPDMRTRIGEAIEGESEGLA